LQYKILIIDDDLLVGRSLKRALGKLGYETEVCEDGGRALESVKSFYPDIVFLDIYLQKYNGISILEEIKKEFIDLPVIMITGFADVNIAVKAMKLGAHDFLLKPLELEHLKLLIERIIANLELKKEVLKLKSINSEEIITPEFFGKNRKVQMLVRSAQKLAKTDTTILLQGESGTGKEEFAKFIHQNSPRANENLVRINCGSIPRELAESELFGHEKGAFTGASQKTKLGKFELADKGTILLDEIGELSMDLQVKLLRVLQEKKFYRVGGEKEISVDVRVIAATNKNLEEEVSKGNFREDLFYRLNVANINIPPLRERKDDIPLLAYSFVDEFSHKFGIAVSEISPEAIELFQNYYWKGNIRELRNVIERAVLLMDENEKVLGLNHLGFLNASQAKGDENDYVLKIPSEGIKIDIVLKDLILKTLELTNGNQLKAARILGLSRSKLRYRMEQLGIEVVKKIS
jgi:two-component system response regulator AtoC